MRSAIVLPLMLLALTAAGGCNKWATIWLEPSTLYADTRTQDQDGFTNKSPQWAYEGEPVTLDFQSDLGATDYAVFFWPDGTQDYLRRRDQVNTYFRGLGTFKAGKEPRKNLVIVKGYSVRGQDDWYYDKDLKKWVYHPMQSDESDFEVGEGRMEIICYRVELDLPFGGKGKTVEDAVLNVIKDDGTRTSHRATDPGVQTLGPDAGGRYRLRYTPTWKEVNRVGKTDVELIVTFADGTQETVSRQVDTP